MQRLREPGSCKSAHSMQWGRACCICRLQTAFACLRWSVLSLFAQHVFPFVDNPGTWAIVHTSGPASYIGHEKEREKN